MKWSNSFHLTFPYLYFYLKLAFSILFKNIFFYLITLQNLFFHEITLRNTLWCEVTLMNLPYTKDWMLLFPPAIINSQDELLSFRTLEYCTCHYSDDRYKNYKHKEIKGNQCSSERLHFLLKSWAIFRIWKTKAQPTVRKLTLLT